MYFPLYSLFPFFHIALQALLFPVIVTPIGDLQEQTYPNRFALDHFILFLLDK